MGQLEVLQDRDDDGRVGEEGEDSHLATTSGAEQWQHLVDASEQHGPRPTFGGCPRAGLVGRAGSASMEGCCLGLELVGLGI